MKLVLRSYDVEEMIVKALELMEYPEFYTGTIYPHRDCMFLNEADIVRTMVTAAIDNVYQYGIIDTTTNNVINCLRSNYKIEPILWELENMVYDHVVAPFCREHPRDMAIRGTKLIIIWE